MAMAFIHLAPVASFIITDRLKVKIWSDLKIKEHTAMIIEGQVLNINGTKVNALRDKQIKRVTLIVSWHNHILQNNSVK